MTVDAFDPAREIVTLTPAAMAHFKREIEKKGDVNAVRLSTRESGCTGYKYVVDLVAEAATNDLHVPLDNGIELLIDAGSLAVVKGVNIDYVLEGVNRELRFNNPNVKDMCGCGESFSVN